MSVLSCEEKFSVRRKARTSPVCSFENPCCVKKCIFCMHKGKLFFSTLMERDSIFFEKYLSFPVDRCVSKWKLFQHYSYIHSPFLSTEKCFSQARDCKSIDSHPDTFFCAINQINNPLLRYGSFFYLYLVQKLLFSSHLFSVMMIPIFTRIKALKSEKYYHSNKGKRYVISRK